MDFINVIASFCGVPNVKTGTILPDYRQVFIPNPENAMSYSQPKWHPEINNSYSSIARLHINIILACLILNCRQ